MSTYNDWYSKFRTQPAAVSILDIFVEYGNEGSIVLLQACLDQVKFQSEDFQSKPDLLSAIFRYFLGRPNFATVFCEALRSKVMSEGFLEGLSKQLHLSTPEKIAVGLALSDSGNTDFRIREDVEKRHQRNIQDHPLFFGITLGLLAEIINSRLFTTVRDSLGLTYDVSFELSLFDRLKLRWYVVSVTSTPGKVYKAVDACKNVLRGLHDSKIAQRELDRMEVLLGKTKKFDDLMVAVAAKGRQLETIKHDGKP
ncbi:uncharacterized protein LOC131242889 isoform X2 [Magnolia sinica]|uniref:uncharacterized protein LOC131242889 isoform X2 n=1 Tax=Magnolia sinica TaxID=86752 RepID=UPI0026583422|nr:uncharacterized protein LOC131242889 isoform X2 [Magnolia sinica]